MPWDIAINGGGGATHHSDTRTLTIQLGEGSFTFVEVEPVDSVGNSKSVFSEGEKVYLKITVRNDGSAYDAAIIRVVDTDTGREITKVGTKYMNPGESMTIPNLDIGTMPDHDWTITVSVEP